MLTFWQIFITNKYICYLSQSFIRFLLSNDLYHVKEPLFLKHKSLAKRSILLCNLINSICHTWRQPRKKLVLKQSALKLWALSLSSYSFTLMLYRENSSKSNDILWRVRTCTCGGRLSPCRGCSSPRRCCPAGCRGRCCIYPDRCRRLSYWSWEKWIYTLRKMLKNISLPYSWWGR